MLFYRKGTKNIFLDKNFYNEMHRLLTKSSKISLFRGISGNTKIHIYFFIKQSVGTHKKIFNFNLRPMFGIRAPDSGNKTLPESRFN